MPVTSAFFGFATWRPPPSPNSCRTASARFSPPGQPGLTGRDLASSRVERQRSLVREIGIEGKVAALTAFAETEVFELHHDGDSEVVIRLEHANVLRCQA